jgi:hypothetical protein
LHCDGCVRWLGGERARIAACTRCDGMLRPLDVRPVVAAKAALRDEAVRVLSRPGLSSAAVVALLGGLSDVPLPLIDWLLALGCWTTLAGTYFHLVDHVACGRTGFPAPVEADSWPWPTLVQRAMLALLAFSTPVLLWLAANPSAESLGELAQARPVRAAFLLLLGQSWALVGAVASVASSSGLATFWPPALAIVLARAPRAWLRLAPVLTGLTLACLTGRWLVGRLLGDLPFVTSFARTLLTALLLFFQAAVLGAFIWQHRERYSPR